MSPKFPAIVISSTGHGELAALDPEPGSAARVVAGHGIEALPISSVTSRPRGVVGDHLLERGAAGLEPEVASAPTPGALPAPRDALPVERTPSLRAE